MKATLFAATLLMLFSTGCTANFTGQWLEEGVRNPDGALVSVTGERRMALDFDPVSGVRVGRYSETIGAVDNTTVQSDQYFVLDGWSKAQFGSMLAKVEGGQMTAMVAGATPRTFRRVSGPSIFPPIVELPSFTGK